MSGEGEGLAGGVVCDGGYVPVSSVVRRFAALVNMCVEVLHDVVETDDDSGALYE